MKEEINIPIISSEKYSKETLNDIVNSLEKLEKAKNNIFGRLNSAFSERVDKLCNLKARINRANKIIADYSNINDALTLKSKYHYPNQKHSFYTPTIIEQNATSINKEPVLKLNKIVSNDVNNLGVKPSVTKASTYDKFLAFSTQFNDIVNQLNNIQKQEQDVRQSLEEFEPILNNVTSDFTFGTNMKIEYAKKQQYNPLQESSRFTSTPSRFSQEYMINEKEEKKRRKKNLQQAPKSITANRKIKQYKRPVKRIKKSEPKIAIDLPSTIQLGGVANLDGGDDEDDEMIQEKEEEEEEEDDDNDDNEINVPLEDEDDDTNTPMDIIRSKNKNKILTSKNDVKNNPNTNYQKPVNTNNNNTVNNNINTSTQVQANNTVPQEPPPPKTTVPPPLPPPQPQPQPQSQPQPQPKPQPKPQPVAPSPPSNVSSSDGSNIVVICGKSSGIPPPPPPPPPPKIVPTIPSKPSAKAENNSEPKLSLQEELEKAKSGLKKKEDVKVEEKPKELSFAEQLLASKNKLKKTVIAPKPVEEKKKTGLDILSQQIRLRFNNLRMHEEEDNSSSGSNDSF